MSADRVHVELERAKETKPWEYALRFVFGGIVTAAVGIIGKAYGPEVAGMFLAFPAILPAAITLIEHHSDKDEAGIDALGAGIGSVGLFGFGAMLWWIAPNGIGAVAIIAATVLWFVVSVALWWVICGRRSG